jgi:hypothetical protein
MNRRGFLSTVMGLVVAPLLPKVEPPLVATARPSLPNAAWLTLDRMVVRVARQRLRKWVEPSNPLLRSSHEQQRSQ